MSWGRVAGVLAQQRGDLAQAATRQRDALALWREPTRADVDRGEPSPLACPERHVGHRYGVGESGTVNASLSDSQYLAGAAGAQAGNSSCILYDDAVILQTTHVTACAVAP